MHKFVLAVFLGVSLFFSQGVKFAHAQVLVRDLQTGQMKQIGDIGNHKDTRTSLEKFRDNFNKEQRMFVAIALFSFLAASAVIYEIKKASSKIQPAPSYGEPTPPPVIGPRPRFKT